MKIIVLMILSCFFVQSSFSQDNERRREMEYFYKLMGGSMNNEVKGQTNTYIVDSLPTGCVVINKFYPYWDDVSDIDKDSVSISVEDIQKLNGIIKDELSRCIDVDKIDIKENMSIRLCSDLSGTVDGLIFSFDSTVHIPIITIEKMEQRIKECCRLKFDKNIPALNHVTYVAYSYAFYLKDILY